MLAMGRATVCRNDLHNISAAFVASSNRRSSARGEPNMYSMAKVYPDAMQWPSVPSDCVPDGEMYRCPEDVRKQSLIQSLRKLSKITRQRPATS